MNPIITRQRTRPQAAVGVAFAGALLTVFGALLSWVSLTVLVAVSVRGYRTDEGKVALALGAVGLLTALVAFLARDGRALFATAMAGVGALIAEVVFAFRLHDAFAGAVADGKDAEAVGEIVDGSLSLETGWVLALFGSLLMVGAGLWAASRHR
ncbi:hypothetical protein [Actinocorallia longicatena]|uniref:Membrane protein (TIGR02234 family) n=1 Tax=Actinocorallia longicatena TaxID=111803 RepID=A0ABP6Q5V4_9ACTN